MQHLIVNSGFDAVCNEKKVDRTRPTGLIGTSPEFRFGIMEWVTNWTFTITQTHFKYYLGFYLYHVLQSISLRLIKSDLDY